MSTIKINELASSAISLTDFFAKADASGVANKNTIQGLSNFLNTVGTLAFKGVLLAADATVTEDGIYVAGDAGTYTNNGGLFITVNDKIVLISITGTQTVFEKAEFPITLTIDAVPTSGSTNVPQSGGVFDAIDTIQTKERTSFLEKTTPTSSDYGWINKNIFTIPASTNYNGKFFGYNLTETNKKTYVKIISNYPHISTIRKGGSIIETITWEDLGNGTYQYVTKQDLTGATNVTINFADTTLHSSDTYVKFEELSVYNEILIEEKINNIENQIELQNRYPFIGNVVTNGSASKLTIKNLSNAVKDVEIYDNRDFSKKYSITKIQKNNTGVWQIRLGYTDSDGFSNPFDVLGFTTSVNPEVTGEFTKHDLTSVNSSKFKGSIYVKWDEIVDGNYFSMLPNLGYELSKDIFKGYEPIYTSKALTQETRVLEEDDFLTAEQIDKIVFPFYLENSDSTKDYFIGAIRRNYTTESPKTRISIFSKDSSNTIELVSQYSIDENKTGIEKVEFVPQTNQFKKALAIINFDEIPENINYNFSSAIKSGGYIFRKEFYSNKANDLSIQVENFDTVYDAVQRAEKGRINVGLTTLQSFNNATSKEDFINVNGGEIVSDLYDFSYVNTNSARLMLIDSKKTMWWRLATNTGIQVFTCSLQDFKDTLVDEADVSGESRKSIQSFTAGNYPNIFSVVETFAPYHNVNQNTVNVTAMRESEGNYVFQDFIDANYVTYPDSETDPAYIGRLFYFDKSINKIKEATLPPGGRKGYMISAWNFDFHKNIVIASGYYNNPNETVKRGKGRILYSGDYGATYTNKFDVETTGLLSDDGYPTPSDFSQREMTHIHGCHIDKFNNNRVYMVIGDASQYIPNIGKIYYTDNIADEIVMWTKLKIDITETEVDNEQYCSVYATSKNVLFGSDMRKNAICRMNKVNDTFSKREVAELVSTNVSGVDYIPGSWRRYNHKEPIVCFNMTGDLGGVPSNIYATYDGIKFFKIWEDTVNHSPFFNRQSVVFGIDGELFSLLQEGSNNRFSSGMTLLIGRYKVE